MGNIAIGGYRVSFKMASGETLTALRFVKQASATTIAAISATTDIPTGVLVMKTARTDYAVPVQREGVIDVEVGAAGVTFGTSVKIDSAGRVIDAGTVAAGEVIVGVAQETATSGNYAKIALCTPFNLA